MNHMPTSLVKQIENVRRQMQRRKILAASCRALAVLLVSVLALASLDRALGFQDPVGRSLLTLAAIAAAMIIGRRWIQAAICCKVSSLEVAHRAEQNYPRFRDLVTSALQFSSQTQNDPWAGSLVLRKAIVLQATSAAKEIAWRQLAPRKPLQKAARSLVGVLLFLLFVAWWTPHGLSTGFLRLVNPLSAVDWPRQDDLQFIDAPTKIAAGNDLNLSIQNTRGPLPEDAQVHFRVWKNDRWKLQTEPVPTTDDIGTISRHDVRETLEIRATGGDHQTMPWHKVEVVPPPRIEELNMVAHPPAYIHTPPRFWSRTTPLLAGSRLEIRGITDQPMDRMALRHDNGQEFMATLNETGREFNLETPPLQPSMSGVLSISMTTQEGVSTQAKQQFLLEVVPDQPPEVALFKPTENRLTLIPEASLPIVIEARDNIQLKSIELVIRDKGAKPQTERLTTLWKSPDYEPDSPTNYVKHQVKRVVVEWTPASYSFQPGAQLEVFARTRDFQSTESRSDRTLHISIVSEDEFRRVFGQAVDPLADKLPENENQGEGNQDHQTTRSSSDSPSQSNSQQPGSTPGQSTSTVVTKNGKRTLAAAGDLVRDLWGSLPDRQQQQILQPLSKDFLPQYAQEIEEYYRALADPDRQDRELP